jgi:deoxyribodipyrimidine photolyase-like uncharacterized protein
MDQTGLRNYAVDGFYVKRMFDFCNKIKFRAEYRLVGEYYLVLSYCW